MNRGAVTGGADGGSDAVAVIGGLREALERSVTMLATTSLLQEGELADVLGALDAVTARSHALMVTVLREAINRGLHTQAGFSETGWLRLVCPALSTREASEIACVAGAAQERVHDPVVSAVEAGVLPVGRAASAVRALSRIRGAVGPTEYAEATGLVARAAVNAELSERDLAQVTAQLVATCLTHQQQVERERARAELRDVHESSLADGSVRRAIITFGDDADYAAFRAVMMSPLAAPRRSLGGADGEPDTRTAGQRRYDALMAVWHRGVAGSATEPTTPKAQVVVTMGLDALTGALPGVGQTVSAGPLSAHRVRQLACEADLIPAVLGGQSEILDLGRSRRLVTPGQRRALAHRDQECTFPGCHVPSTWCDAHHVLHWARGGRSEVSNYALLCARHHTWVHQQDVTATVDPAGVTWHLR